MRTLAIGDIHGCLTALTTLMETVSPSPDDLVVTLGDYVDHGSQSAQVLDYLIDFEQRHCLIPLRGNHEQMMLQAREDNDSLQYWLEHGGDAALNSYETFQLAGDDPSTEKKHPIIQSLPPDFSQTSRIRQLHQIPSRHWDFLKKRCRNWYETDTHFFTHATVAPHIPLERQSSHDLFWKKFSDPQPHVSGKITICGHTPQRETGRPKNLGFAVCIDTWVYGQGWLTCLDVHTGQYWQANEKGMSRSDRLASSC